MEWGMMWFYGEKIKSKDVKPSYRSKMIEAVEYFREKYRYDGLVDVRVKELVEFEPIPNVNVKQMKEILTNTFWIGVDRGDFRKDDDKGLTNG